MDKKTTLILGIAAVAIVAFFLWQGYGQSSQGSLKITVYDNYGMPIGDAESGFGLIPGAFIYTDPSNKLMFEPGYSIGIEALVNMNYTLSGSSSGSVLANWKADGTFIQAAKNSPTATVTGTVTRGINQAGEGTFTMQASVGNFAYADLDEDIPSTGSKSYTMTFSTTATISDAAGNTLKTVTGTQSLTVTLESTVSGALSIVSITFSPWIETPTTGFF